MTSKIMEWLVDIWMISPELRQSFLLSSRTVFMFSIHRASTGPSSTSHLRREERSPAQARKVTASTPSVHSCVAGSFWPYSCPMVTDLGLMTYVSTSSCPSCPSACILVSARPSTWYDRVLPEKGNPTIMSPCRTTTISYSWVHLSRK